MSVFFRFFERRSFVIYLNIKCHLGLYNYKNTVVQLRGCHGLHTADVEFVLKKTAIDYVVY